MSGRNVPSSRCGGAGGCWGGGVTLHPARPPRGSAGDSRLTPHYARGVPAVPKKGSKRRRSGTRHLAAESSVALTRTAAPDRDETRGGRTVESASPTPWRRTSARKEGAREGMRGPSGARVAARGADRGTQAVTGNVVPIRPISGARPAYDRITQPGTSLPVGFTARCAL